MLDSELFNYHFDFDDWDNKHADSTTIQAPFNGNPLQLRDEYRNVFKGKLDYDLKSTTTKPHQIRYRLSMLPYVGPKDDELIESLIGSETEIEVFETQAVQDLIDYRWNLFAKRQHVFGFSLHMLYVLLVMLFVNSQYLQYTHHPLPDCDAAYYEHNLDVVKGRKSHDVGNVQFERLNCSINSTELRDLLQA